MEYFTTHSIDELVDLANKEREKYKNYTPIQVWTELIQLTHFFRTFDGVDKDQSKALYEIEEICVNQKDAIYLPKKKKK